MGRKEKIKMLRTKLKNYEKRINKTYKEYKLQSNLGSSDPGCDTVTNGFKGALHSLAAVVGAGSFYDPVGDATSTLQNAKEAQQNMLNQYNITVITEMQKEWTDFITYMNTEKSYLLENMDFFQNQTNDQFKQVNIYLITLGILIFIILYFNLFTKKSL